MSVLQSAYSDNALLVCGHYKETKRYRTTDLDGSADWILAYTVSGRGQYNYPGGALFTSPGDVVILRPHTPRDQMTAPEPGAWELAWAHFQPRVHWHDWLRLPEISPGLMYVRQPSADVQGEIGQALADMNRLAMRSGANRYSHVMNALERAILWIGGSSDEGAFDGRVRRVMDYLLERISERVTIAETAAVVNLSPSRLSHLFQAQTGKTPMHYIEEKRIARACELLRVTNRSIGDISADLGFEHLFYFSRRFKLAVGISPRAYRGQRMSYPHRYPEYASGLSEHSVR